MCVRGEEASETPSGSSSPGKCVLQDAGARSASFLQMEEWRLQWWSALLKIVRLEGGARVTGMEAVLSVPRGPDLNMFALLC